MSKRLTGLLLPVFSTRRVDDLGVGDTASLMEWLELSAAAGVKFLQLLPIHETGADDSPYNAISSVALEPLYLTMEKVPGVDPLLLAVERATTVDGVAVNYRAARAAKRRLLEDAWRRADREDEDFLAFVAREKPWLEPYAFFRWLMDQAGGSEVWDLWGERWQDADRVRRELERELAEGGSPVADRVRYYQWVQWLCFRQWGEVRRCAEVLGVKLMGDVPIGVSRYSADVYFGRGDFDLDWCGGAPPETVFKYDRFIQKWGQNWGIPLYRWDRMEEDGYPWWRQRIAKVAEVFHLFRVDHVLGFYRIYAFPWQPQRNAEFLDLTEEEARLRTGGRLPEWSPRPDDTEENREANRADGDRRLRVVQEAAGATEVVGEDLGCVPEYVRPHLASLGIAGFRIPQWDEDEEGHVVSGEDLPECSFTTYATHDHESLPALWEGLCRVAADESADEEEREKAAAELRRLMEFAGIEAPGSWNEGVKGKLFDALLGSNSRYVAIMVTDLFDSRERINSPGTVGCHNWSWRLRWTAGEVPRGALEDLARRIEAAGR